VRLVQKIGSGRIRVGTRVSLRGTILAAAGFAALAVGGAAAATTTPPDDSSNYSFQTHNNPADPTFNQLLGINTAGLIAGYYGSGMKGHPNKGYTLSNFGKGSFHRENYPGSAQTQVVGLNDLGVTVGFWVSGKGANHGFYAIHGKHFKTADYPTNSRAKPAVDQLLGVNDRDVAVGFYNDSKGNSHGYSYDINRKRFHSIGVAGASSVTAAAINNQGDIAGFYTNGAGNVVGFLKFSTGRMFTLSFPGATMTQPFGVNDGDEVVGSYQLGTGSSATTYGFTWSPGTGFATVSDPSGIGSTVVNGVNDRGWLVGFYTDSSGNTDGFVANPQG
jgi:hypothetical protein